MPALLAFAYSVGTGDSNVGGPTLPGITIPTATRRAAIDRMIVNRVRGRDRYRFADGDALSCKGITKFEQGTVSTFLKPRHDRVERFPRRVRRRSGRSPSHA
ncbi:hypothetical protein AB4Z52_27105 [Rhizobium sp. 2YAF20]|uniref:hypothetical protein n=1 Tax=Rhizobium sp. 2YAF20 TaxID=3233027 RepID=UPI003F9CE53F